MNTTMIWLETIIIICMFLSHFSSGSSSSLKTRVSTRGNFGNSTGGVEKSPMITTAHSVRGGQQQQRAEDVMSARKQVSHQIKFIYSEKATKFCEIFPLLLTVCTVVKSKVKISQNFVAFSEYMNFIWCKNAYAFRTL